MWKQIGTSKDNLSMTCKSIFRLYKIFIDEAMPTSLIPFDVYVEVMKSLFSVNIVIKHYHDGTELLHNASIEETEEFDFFDVNKFMVFMVS